MNLFAYTGGETIRYLEKVTGARIQIESSSVGPERTITITGAWSCCAPPAHTNGSPADRDRTVDACLDPLRTPGPPPQVQYAESLVWQKINDSANGFVPAEVAAAYVSQKSIGGGACAKHLTVRRPRLPNDRTDRRSRRTLATTEPPRPRQLAGTRICGVARTVPWARLFSDTFSPAT